MSSLARAWLAGLPYRNGSDWPQTLLLTSYVFGLVLLIEAACLECSSTTDQFVAELAFVLFATIVNLITIILREEPHGEYRYMSGVPLKGPTFIFISFENLQDTA